MLDGSQRDIVHDRKIVEQIKMLEYHSHVSAHFVNIGLGVRDILSVEPYFSAGGCLQQIQAAQESAFARSGRSHDHDLLSRVDMITDTTQHMVIFKFFVQVLNDYHSCAASFPILPTI